VRELALIWSAPACHIKNLLIHARKLGTLRLALHFEVNCAKNEYLVFSLLTLC